MGIKERARKAFKDAGISPSVYDDGGHVYALLGGVASWVAQGPMPTPSKRGTDPELQQCLDALEKAGLHGQPDTIGPGRIRITERA